MKRWIIMGNEKTIPKRTKSGLGKRLHWSQNKLVRPAKCLENQHCRLDQMTLSSHDTRIWCHRGQADAQDNAKLQIPRTCCSREPKGSKQHKRREDVMVTIEHPTTLRNTRFSGIRKRLQVGLTSLASASTAWGTLITMVLNTVG